MFAPRLMQCARYLVKAARCLDPRSGAASGHHRHASHTEAELLGKVEEYNQAAERQWQAIANDAAGRGHVLSKPISTVRDTAAIFSHIGLALEALDLGVGHTVLDFGAGSCWLSAILNRLGAHTISMDVSPTALSLGRDVFASDPRIRQDLAPEFIAFDGHRIPLADSSVDRIVCFDAFHHVPNQTEILRELFRVLKSGGRLVLAEPGEGHASTDHSRVDAETYGVLENDLHLDELIVRARAVGFGRAFAKPYPDPKAITLTAEAYLRLVGGDHSLYPMHILQDHLRVSHVVMLLKGEPEYDSRNPHLLSAMITPMLATPVTGKAGMVAELPVRLENLGDTTWLSAQHEAGGYVKLSGHLLDLEGRALRRGFFAQGLPKDIRPGERAEFTARFHLPERLGRFRLVLDMVDEKVAWFEQCGSRVAQCEVLVVDWPDSRAPHRLQAEIEILDGRPPGPVEPGANVSLRLRITNTGDTRWLTSGVDEGLVRVGVQLLALDGSMVERDYHRAPLPKALDPSESIEIGLVVPAPARAGRFLLSVDLVAELVSWFQQHGSKPAVFELDTTRAASWLQHQ